jgi:carboxylesterase
MMTTDWLHWSTEAEDALQRLMLRCDKVVVAGLSMGGTLTLWLATMYSRISGIVCINPATQPHGEEVLAMAQGMFDEGTTVLPGIGSDIADPDVVEVAYGGTPLGPLLSLQRELKRLQYDYGQITCPMLLMTSPNDHVVDPAQSDYLAAHAGGAVERVTLERSYHVATLDHDRDVIRARAVEFATRVTS